MPIIPIINQRNPIESICKNCFHAFFNHIWEYRKDNDRVEPQDHWVNFLSLRNLKVFDREVIRLYCLRIESGNSQTGLMIKN